MNVRRRVVAHTRMMDDKVREALLRQAFDDAETALVSARNQLRAIETLVGLSVAQAVSAARIAEPETEPPWSAEELTGYEKRELGMDG
jgi:chemotaxis regulatin CheY-phosphate phosphatase CheZ